MKHSTLLEYETPMVLALLLAFLIASVTGLFLSILWIPGVAFVVCFALFIVLNNAGNAAFIAAHQEDES